MIPRLTVAIAAVSLLMGAEGQSQDRYSAGQVWEYHTRPGDEGSLLKIQSIEADPAFAKLGPVFHISIIGFKARIPQALANLPHAPVSRETLDKSVTRLSRSTTVFPDAKSGMDEWRAAKGGIFTISVAEIVALVDEQAARINQ